MLNRTPGAAPPSTDDFLVPIEGAWVCRAGRPDAIGVVLGREGDGVHVDFGPKLGKAFLRQGEWASGLKRGFTVQDVPLSASRAPFGVGTVREARAICGRDQALVQFHHDGSTRWLPFERLRHVMDPTGAFIRAAQHEDRAAERTALNVMAHALRLWNEATGALDRLDVDPLPHQISLVHRIVTSGSKNWLIADDVGLGKTIEVGLLLAALERRQSLRRVLVIAPAGLTRQWQDEMTAKFDRRFLIYGRDFEIHDPQDWPRYERVIASLDLVKPQNGEDGGSDVGTRFGMLLAAGGWDAVIFDEAHRLSKAESGETTLRYRLAGALRDRTDAMFLLSGTPHQGDQARFQNLLTLVRPDLAREIDMLEFQPEIVRDMILRNRKIDAVDAEGDFLFRGALVRRLEVETTEGMAGLERRLKAYLSRGYAAGERLGGAQGRAIGFVMTVYRKLASSSVYALGAALMKRKARLLAQAQGAATPVRGREAEEEEGDDLLSRAGSLEPAAPFFADELARLEELIAAAKECLRHDPKLAAFRRVAEDVVRKNGKKLLVFTEYRETQAYLALWLDRIGVTACALNGSQSLDEKRAAIERFENEAQVMVSTEAGGEGLNLQRRCHVMVNYDLPWNPARLTQRIGRLYRYGQTEQVVVVNFHARDTIDNEILSNVIDRLDAVARAMTPVNAEYGDRYHSEIMGELLERLDIDDLLAEAAKGRVERTAERIEAAIEAAKRAKQLQDDILSAAAAHDPARWREMGALSTAHLAGFIVRAAPFLGFAVEPSRTDPQRFTLRLPAEWRGRFAEFGGRTVIAATTRRGSSPDQAMLDFASPFVRHLVAAAGAPEFGGGFGALEGDALPGRTWGLFLQRWQNDQGQPTGEALAVAVEQPDGRIDLDHGAIARLLEGAQETAKPAGRDATARKQLADALRDRAELAMAEACNRFQHPNDLICLAVLESGAIA